MRSLRFFRRRDPGDKRHGLWVMSTENDHKGSFIHGDRDTIDGVKWPLSALIAMSQEPNGLCVEVLPSEALETVANWPDAHEFVRKALLRYGHKLDSTTGQWQWKESDQ